jgi:OmcA/MtrC family decaheme c-type cytochrome
MRQFNVLFRWGWTFLVVVTLSLAGCDGDNGAAGAAGAAGTAGLPGDDGVACWDLNGNGVGDPGEDINGDGLFDAADCAGTTASATPLESCGVCHDDGSSFSASAAHALPPIESVSNVAFAVNVADLDVTFDLAADGVLATNYDSMQRGYRTDGTTRTDICGAASRSDPCDPALVTLTNNGGGNYTIKVLGGAAEALNDNRYLFRVGAGDDRETRVYFYGDFPATPIEIEPLVVSAEACNACHGPERLSGIHGGYYAAADGGETCVTCHGVDTVPSLGAVAHGLHSSILEDNGEPIEITYPTYMNNCSVCHSEAAQLAAANTMPVAADACFSCHGSTAGIPFVPNSSAETLHANIPDGCQSCHAGQISGIPQTVTEVHNGALTGRSGVIWDGVDTSVTEGAKIAWVITGVADDGTDLTITWQASYDGVGVDPCNATAGAGVPVFFADANGGNLSILRNYAQGEDFILGTRDDRAGQPGGTPGVSADNTTCAGNVATTVVPVEATDATYGRVAIQGKPRLPSPDPDDTDGLMQVRAFTPTYDWVIGETGAAPARRAVADSSLCLTCHVGSLYQHGGNRVDNIDMCYLCHNAAANDEYVRVDDYGVDASEAYDGRAGQAFGIKEMVHAVHPAGALGNRVVIYRGRGIYGWAADESQLSNWPGSGDDLPVFGSDDGTGNPVLQNHIFHSPTYPRGLYDCAACHVATVDILPDPTKAMATTVEAGQPPFGDQLNDVLEGVQTNSCITCHADSASKGHAYQNSWTPQVFPEGRQTIIDAN